MHAMFAVVFALLGLATVTAGAATPSNSVEASFVAKDAVSPSIPPSTPQLGWILHNASSLLGWELTAMANSTSQLVDACNNFDSYSAQWANIGLIVDDIKAPICNSSTADTIPSASDIRVQIYIYNTDVFIAQILHAFASSAKTTSTAAGELTPLAYLCRYALSYHLLDAFDLNSQRVMEAVCAAGGQNLRPELEGGQITGNTSLTTDFHTAVSELFAWELAAVGATAADQAQLCAAAEMAVDGLSALNLYGTLVEKYVCYNPKPLTAAEAIANVIQTSTEAFVAEIKGVSEVDGWVSWLCGHLGLREMGLEGLDGTLVMDSVC